MKSSQIRARKDVTKSDLLLSLEFCKILDTKTDRLTAGESSQFCG